MAVEKKETEKTLEKKVASKTNGKATTDTKKTTTKKVVAKNATTATTKVAKPVEKVENSNGNDINYKKLQKENEGLKTDFKELTDKFNQLLEKMVLQGNQTPQTIHITQPQVSKYKVINLTSDSNTIELKALGDIITLRGYEDWIEVSEDKFRDIVRGYHNLFRMGALTTDSDGAKILEQRKVRIANRWLTKREISTLDTLNTEELIKLYKTLHPRQKEVLVDKFIEGINYGEKEGFKDPSKIIALSQNYDGVFSKKRLQNAILKVTEQK